MKDANEGVYDQDEAADEPDSNRSTSDSDPPESSGEKYKQPSSSSGDDEDDDEEAQLDADEPQSPKSKSTQSDVDSVAGDVSSEMERHQMDTFFHFTQPDDATSRISDSMGEQDDKGDGESDICSDDNKQVSDKDTQEDPDKTIEYHLADLSRSLEDSFHKQGKEPMEKSGNYDRSKMPADVVLSAQDDTHSTISQTTPKQPSKKTKARPAKVPKTKSPRKWKKLIVKMTTPTKKKKNSVESGLNTTAKTSSVSQHTNEASKEDRTQTLKKSAASQPTPTVKTSKRDGSNPKSGKTPLTKSVKDKDSPKTVDPVSVQTSSKTLPGDPLAVVNKSKDSQVPPKDTPTRTTKTKPTSGDSQYADIPIGPFGEDFGDMSKPKDKPSTKFPSKSSKKKSSVVTAIPPTPPRPTKRHSQKPKSSTDTPTKPSGKSSEKTKKKKHKSASEALKTLSTFRRTVGSIVVPETGEPPQKKKEWRSSLRTMMMWEGQALPILRHLQAYLLNRWATKVQRNPILWWLPKRRMPKKNNFTSTSICYKTNTACYRPRKTTSQAQASATKQTPPAIDQEKVNVLKKLTEKYGTSQSPIIIAKKNNFRWPVESPLQLQYKPYTWV